ncbi:hypothetical protein [Halonotius aquaticus]|uniref:hypothetical protein n=1 Tax=Halonotius aquaticus TaxID=2216978 RepID=UPI0010591508|nr:hypothetical protein [Halonotius aquaticus]
MSAQLSDLIRPVDRSAGSSLLPQQVLNEFYENEPLTPRDIAQNRLRESAIRLDCFRFVRLGLVREIGEEMYIITDTGKNTIKEGSDPLGDYSEVVKDSNKNFDRITDISVFDSRSVKQANLDMLENEKQTYGLILDDRHKTKRRILNVSGNRIYRILREFPFDEPFLTQCAHWMRAFTGLHLFPDGNHRTGMYLLQILLKYNNIDDNPLPGDDISLYRTILRSKLIRLLQLDSVGLRDLWKKDEYFAHWHRYFRNLFLDVRNTAHTTCSTAKLERALREAKSKNKVRL